MLGINIQPETQALIDSQPERKPPLSLSRNRMAAIMLAESAAERDRLRRNALRLRKARK